MRQCRRLMPFINDDRQDTPMDAGSITWIGALVGLALAIGLILKKFNPVYSLFLGAIIGSFVGGATPVEVIKILTAGDQSVIGTVLRVLAAGVLAGVMMETGAAETMATAIVEKLGEKRALLALALASMVICSVGVFIPVTVLIVAPIALDIGARTGISKLSLLVAVSGGAKAGNIISPNPNTIAAAAGFELELSQVMMAGYIPALFGLVMAVVLATMVKTRGTMVRPEDLADQVHKGHGGPTLRAAVVAPAVAIVLLMLNPLGALTGIHALQQIKLDALFILPLAGIIGLAAMKKLGHVAEYVTAGLNRMTPTALILLGAGGIGGMISASSLPHEIVRIIQGAGISGTLLAPISGILMASATASTATGVILATGSFAQPILAMGTTPLAAAVMMHTGATVIDAMPHGNYFHASADAMKMDMGERMKLIPYEAAVGGVMCLVATVLYGFIL